MMGLYARYLGPRFVRCLCSSDDISAERAKIVPLARGTVLEIGFGPGLNLPFYDPGLVERVIGVDPNDGFLSLGEEAWSQARIPLEIIRASAEALPLSDESVDTALVTYTLCSVDDPMRSLRELRRVLKPDGRILFLEHGLSSDPGVARWQYRLNPIWRPLAVGCNLTRPVIRLLAESGFAVEEAEEYYLQGVPRAVGFLSRGTARPSPKLACAEVDQATTV
jgi:ubiquinone/menaquinone biosynthesis C-methylase UbiE